MKDLFDNEFLKVLGDKNWWELYDSEDFEIVVNNIANKLNISVEDLKNTQDFIDWDYDFYCDL